VRYDPSRELHFPSAWKHAHRHAEPAPGADAPGRPAEQAASQEEAPRRELEEATPGRKKGSRHHNDDAGLFNLHKNYILYRIDSGFFKSVQ